MLTHFRFKFTLQEIYIGKKFSCINWKFNQYVCENGRIRQLVGIIRYLINPFLLNMLKFFDHGANYCND